MFHPKIDLDFSALKIDLDFSQPKTIHFCLKLALHKLRTADHEQQLRAWCLWTALGARGAARQQRK